MDTKIIAQYETLFDDLKGYGIIDYLSKRHFKVSMTKCDYYDVWVDAYEQVENNQSVYLVGHRSDLNKSDTLSYFLNQMPENKRIEEFVIAIITSFIDYKETNTDFSNLIESLTLSKFKPESISKVQEAISEHENKKLPNKEENKAKSITKSKIDKSKVFIVHGHNDASKQSVARFIERIGLTAIVLSEQANTGDTIMEKLEKNTDVGFAIVLYTGCDIGGKDKAELKPRARQNVVFEHGYLIGKLGRSKVCALQDDGVETPGDISGVVYIPLDQNDGWKIKLGKELKSAGYDVDLNKAF